MDYTNQYRQEFKKLEKLLHIASGKTGDTTHFPTLLHLASRQYPLLQHREFEHLALDLNGLRNVLEHSDRDKYIAEIKPVALEHLQKLITLLKTPPKVGSALKKKKDGVYCAFRDYTVTGVVKTMQSRTYTHVPVYESETNYKFLGVFSEASIFNWYADFPSASPPPSLADNSFRKYLHNKTDHFEFRATQASIFDIIALFDNYLQNGKRLGAIFITKRGNNNEKPLNIITAWDIPEIKQFLSL